MGKADKTDFNSISLPPIDNDLHFQDESLLTQYTPPPPTNIQDPPHHLVQNPPPQQQVQDPHPQRLLQDPHPQQLFQDNLDPLPPPPQQQLQDPLQQLFQYTSNHSSASSSATSPRMHSNVLHIFLCVVGG
ncbi:unnamed protein product [Trifolium pratense]|uniref:Uncharacterized protein n=1 Tax=Trifolium pratense TaxID=57577 RepID=A0ACB0IVI3_TRIPR|nr:unnamed protein product [Trifolium pratense]